MKGRYFDLSSEPPADDAGANEGAQPRQGARYLGVNFQCCRVYHRVYLNAEGTAYRGNCPRCARPVHIRVGPEGMDSRFFTAF